MSTTYPEFMARTIGDFGIAQLIISCACVLPKITGAWLMTAIGFFSYVPDWWRFRTHYNATNGNTTIYRDFQTCPIEASDTIVFDTSFQTIITEWALVCSYGWIVTTIQTTQMVGVLCGAALFGQLGDLYGRKLSFQISQLVQIISIVIQGFSVNWYMFTVTAFFLGIGNGGFFALVNVYIAEFIGKKWRTLISSLPTFGVGVMTFGGFIFLLPHWKYVCFLMGSVASLFFIILFFTPESARWLFTHGKTDKGKEVIANMAKRNNKQKAINFQRLEEILDRENQDGGKRKSYSYFSLMRYKSTRKISILLGITWLLTGFAYYGQTLGIGDLSGSVAVNYVLMGIGDLLSVFVVLLFTKCFGRKYCTIHSYTLTAILLFGVTISHFATKNIADFQMSMKILSLVSRLFLATAWASLVVYTSELYPTVVRGTGYGFVSVMSRIGGIIAPQNNTLFEISHYIPFTLNAVFTLISGIALFFLPDTQNTSMEDYIAEEKLKSPLEASNINAGFDDEVLVSHIEYE